MIMVMSRSALIIALLLAAPAYAGRSFNGSTDVITVPGVSNAIDLTGTQATWSCWFKLSSLPGANTVAPFVKNSVAGVGYAFTISVSAEQPPVLSVPGNQYATPGQVLSINGVSVSDADAVAYNETTTVTLSDAEGLLSVTPVSGATVTGEDSTQLTLAGTRAVLRNE